MKLSIAKSFSLLFAPLAIAAAVIIAVALRAQMTLKQQTDELQTFIRASDLALSSTIHVSEMGSALKGYLLNPKDEAEAERKDKADEENGKALDELAKIDVDERSLELIKAMDDHDENLLNPAEDESIALARRGDVKGAQAYFVEKYLPLRATYDKMSVELAERARRQTFDKVAEFQANLAAPVYRILITLITALSLFGIAMAWTVRHLTRRLNEVVNTLADEANQVAGISTDVLTSSGQISGSTSTQASALQETAAALDELNAMVRRNADSAVQSTNVAKQSQQSATRGRDAVQEMMGVIRKIDDSNAKIMSQVEASNQEIMGIVQMINEIGAKTKIINDIVFQTKLLSFNASVEAARAGEHGKGFAVVAEEVGNLAQTSGSAAQEISQMLDANTKRVESIVLNTKSNVEGLIRSGRAQVNSGVQTAERCHAALEEIVRQFNELGGMVDDISTGSQEQSKGLDEIAKALAELERTMNQNSAVAQSSAELSARLQAQSDQLQTVVSTLSSVVRGSKAAPQDADEPAAS